MFCNELFESAIREAREAHSSQMFESVLREADELNNRGILSIKEDDNDKALSKDDLKTKYKKYLMGFQGKIFKNKSTGLDIKVSADSIRELLTKHRPRYKMITWKYLNVFIEDSILDSSSNDYKNRPEIEDSKSFHYHCLINDLPYDIILIMRKAVDDIDKLRYYKLVKIKAEKK